MLAYVFWHWRRPDAPVDAYESRQRAFQRALTAAPPPGFQRSTTWAISGAPWANGGGEAWEDWYQMGSSADLDRLEEAAISASRQAPHDAIAALAAGGTGGLYKLRDGDAAVPARHCWWFAKPDGMRYPELLALMAPLCAGGRAALWCRQMTLGPALEFCLHAPDAVKLPDVLETRHIALRQVFP